jgi:hypothetical protein
LLQQSQTFESIILVFIIVVRLHSDAYVRTLTLSHKMRGVKVFLFFLNKIIGFQSKTNLHAHIGARKAKIYNSVVTWS